MQFSFRDKKIFKGNSMRLISTKRNILIVILSVFSMASLAADKSYERSAFMHQGEETTDDPRRVPVPAGYGDHDTVLVLVGGRVLDGTGAEARDATVVTQGKKIAAILELGNSQYPEGAQIIDISGKTIMPGLIELHSHLTYAEADPALAENLSDGALRGVERLRYYLESGITTVRDVASQNDAIFRLKDWVNAGKVPGPRIYAAGQLIVGKGGHGSEGNYHTAPGVPQSAIREASGVDDWREAVREQFKNGADLIKLASHYSPEEIKAAVDEAHRLGLRVTVDAETHYVAMAVQAGVDSVEHPLPRSDKTIRLMAKKGIASVPTIVPYDIIMDEWKGYYGSTSRRFSLNKDTTRDMLKKLHQGGVKLGIATDLVAHWFRYLPQPYIAELKTFVETLAYTPAEALVAATRTNAEILGMEDKLGTLEQGKLADLLVINGNPDQNLDDLAKVDMVIRDGRVAVKNGQVVVSRHKPVPMPKSGDN